MCMSKGAPKKPEYGPCGERHGYNLTSTWWNAGNDSATDATATATWILYTYADNTTATTASLNIS